MKAAISVPDKLFKSGDALAKRLGISRSRLYAEALADRLARQRGKDITKRFNDVYRAEDSRLDEVVNELQVRSLPPAKNGRW
jgi:biotin operon repressor